MKLRSYRLDTVDPAGDLSRRDLSARADVAVVDGLPTALHFGHGAMVDPRASGVHVRRPG